MVFGRVGTPCHGQYGVNMYGGFEGECAPAAGTQLFGATITGCDPKTIVEGAMVTLKTDKGDHAVTFTKVTQGEGRLNFQGSSTAHKRLTGTVKEDGSGWFGNYTPGEIM